MSARVNHPLKSFLLFLVVCGVGYAGYHYIHVKGVLRMENKTYVPGERLDEMRGLILETFGTEECLLELGPVHYRPKDDRYRVDLIIEDGYDDRARVLCQEVAEFVEEKMGRAPEVFAMTTGQNVVTRYLP